MQNYDFVAGIRRNNLALTASLKAAQVASSILLYHTTVAAVSTRILIQNALTRYNTLGNNTSANWVNTVADLESSLISNGQTILLQAIVFPKNDTAGNPYGLVNITASSDKVTLPYKNANGTAVQLGDSGTGYPPDLYPNLTYAYSDELDAYGQNITETSFNGTALYSNSSLLLGPLNINDSYSLLSITVPVDANTNKTNILGWLTIVVDAGLILDVIESPEGLGETGQVLLIGPETRTNKFAVDDKPTYTANRDGSQLVKYIFPPQNNATLGYRHMLRSVVDTQSVPFLLKQYYAALRAWTVEIKNSYNNAGSLLSTTNDENKRVSVGFATLPSIYVEWVLLIEMAHSEVVRPIVHLRNTLLACVFGVTGGLLLLLCPLAHFSVRPIRQLRAATKKTIEPYIPPSGEIDSRSMSSYESDADDEAEQQRYTPSQELARKEGFVAAALAKFGKRRKAGASDQEAGRRRRTFRIPGKVADRKHFIHDELTDLTTTFNEMSEELVMQYQRLEERVKERTQELEASKKIAEAANASKTLFIANISHELKTPLNGILGMCAVSMQEEDTTRIRRSLGIIYKSGDLLLHLLTDLLTFSKNEVGQQLSLDEKEFRLVDITSQVLSIFEKQATEGQITLSVQYQGPHNQFGGPSDPNDERAYGPRGTGRVKDMYLWGDQHRILQVLINLVSNSLKFTPPGGSVVVRLRCVGEEAAQPLEVRKTSVTSKQSKRSRSSKHSKRKSKRKAPPLSHENSDHSVTSAAESEGADETSSQNRPPLTINVAGSSKQVPRVAVRERSMSPPPLNTMSLAFDFEVEDTGPGIPETQQKQVFEPFVQGDLGLSKKYGGTGLGLSICAQLAGLMGGTISLDSTVGVGSKFSMRIPLRYLRDRADSSASSQIRLSHPNSLAERASSEGIRTPPNGLAAPNGETAADANAPAPFDTPGKTQPRLVGLSQPYFAQDSPIDAPLQTQLPATITPVDKDNRIRVLVAEDNKVNQEVVLRMLKLEDIYGKQGGRHILHKFSLSYSLICRCDRCAGWTGSPGKS